VALWESNHVLLLYRSCGRCFASGNATAVSYCIENRYLWTYDKRRCAAAAICAHWSWDNCIGGIDTGVFCLLSDVIKADLYYLFVSLVCGLVVPEAQSM
jgi:hypothetical protein